MNEFIAQEPMWLRGWILWMVVVNFGALLFLFRLEGGRPRLGRPEPRWVFAAMLASGVFMSWLFEQVGYVRLLGVSHVIFWTPLVVYLWRRRLEIPAPTPTWVYLWVVGITNATSLVIDYVDVVRWALGDGELA